MSFRNSSLAAIPHHREISDVTRVRDLCLGGGGSCTVRLLCVPLLLISGPGWPDVSLYCLSPAIRVDGQDETCP